jgi:hypothetical protein
MEMAVFLVTEHGEHLWTDAWRCLEVDLS